MDCLGAGGGATTLKLNWEKNPKQMKHNSSKNKFHTKIRKETKPHGWRLSDGERPNTAPCLINASKRQRTMSNAHAGRKTEITSFAELSRV